MSLIAPPIANRPWYKRMTIMWGAATAALMAVEQSGVIAPGTTQALAASVTQIGTAFLTLIGLYRQVAAS